MCELINGKKAKPERPIEILITIRPSHTQLITLGHYRFFVLLSQQNDSCLKDVMLWHIIFVTADVSRKELKIPALNRVLLENLLVSYIANFPLLLYSATVAKGFI
jgi:hypothetical protein